MGNTNYQLEEVIGDAQGFSQVFKQDADITSSSIINDKTF
jgi:hypothetical protein